MSNFLHGLGGGLGRGIGRAIAYIVIGFLIYFVINILDLDIIDFIKTHSKHLLMFNVKADSGYVVTDITNHIQSTSTCGNAASGYYCMAIPNQTSWNRVQTKSDELGVYPLSIEFSYQNPNMQYLVSSTIAVISYESEFKRLNYSCTITYSGGSASCNAVYSNSSRININFTSPNNNPRITIRLTAGGDTFTRGDYFGIKEVRLIQPNNVDQTNADIIQNNTQNTQDIIQNNNDNTQDIIQNQNDNFMNLIDKGVSNMLNELNSQRTQVAKMCTNAYDVPVKIGKRLNNSGNEVDSPNTFYSDFVNISWISGTHTRIRIENPSETSSTYITVAYDSNYAYLGRTYTGTRNWNLPTGTQYIRFASPVSNTMIFADGPCVSSGDITNDLIKDDSIDQSQADSFFTNFNDNQHGLSGIITLPLTTIQSLTSSSCVALQLPIPFTDGNITLPCMSEIYQTKAPALYSMWQVVCYGLIGYWIATDLFKLVKGFKDPEDDKVEVMDL